VVSLFDKTRQCETLGRGGGNRLVVYTDPWKLFNAWDISRHYRWLPRVTLHATAVEFDVEGARAVRRTTYRHGKTRFVQQAILTADSPVLEFSAHGEWHERFQMLRAEFTPAVWSDTVQCDIPFGSFARTTRNKTAVEKAQFEICAHKWIDVSDGTAGFSLLNDGKYGHRVKASRGGRAGTLSLNLLRSPWYPDPTADQGPQSFRYGLYPHAGDFSQGTLAQAWAFNLPPRPVATPLPPLVALSAANLTVETVKKAEVSDAVVLRITESHGLTTTAAVTLGFTPGAAFETNLLEEAPVPARLERLTWTPFETKTLVVYR
jgi:alpha-mannosidase